ncbi:MAG: Mov34/MPN/PAD-1 family protein [Candidatus Altiarchaeota archaeon]
MKIRKSALEFALNASKNFYPKEFSGLLRGNKKEIKEILILPGTIFGENFSMQRRDMVPIDKTIIGSIHSHPGKNFLPSNEDLKFFKRTGILHIIVSYPYESIEDVHAYDQNGTPVNLEIL